MHELHASILRWLGFDHGRINAKRPSLWPVVRPPRNRLCRMELPQGLGPKPRSRRAIRSLCLPTETTPGRDASLSQSRALQRTVRHLDPCRCSPRAQRPCEVQAGLRLRARRQVLSSRNAGSRRARQRLARRALDVVRLWNGKTDRQRGARVIHWSPFRGPILQAGLAELGRGTPKLRNLFLNGSRLVRARTPNLDRADALYGGWAMMQGAAGPDAFKYPAGLLIRSISKPAQSEIFTFVGPNGGFGSETLPVTSIDVKAASSTLAPPGARPPLGFSETAASFSKTPSRRWTSPANGAWTLRREKSICGRHANSAPESPIVAPILPTLLTLSGARWIKIVGFTFAETSDGWRGSVRCEGSDHISFENNRFVGLGGRGLEILGRDRPASNVTVQRNEFADTGSCGLYLGGSVGDCRIVDNDVHHCGVSDKYSAGIEFPFYGGSAADIGPRAYTDRILIAHNHVHDLPRDGIQLGANPYGRNVVEYNRVERTALETIDAGGIRCHRVISHLQGVAHMPQMAGHLIRHNLVADTRGCGVAGGRIVTPYPWPTFGIYLDEGSSHCTVYGNVVLRSGVGAIINPGEFNTLENNVFAGNTVGIFFQAVPLLDKLRPPLGGNRFVHNIIVLAKGENFGYSLRNWTDKTLALSDFNLFWNAGGSFHLQTQSRPGQAADNANPDRLAAHGLRPALRSWRSALR